MAIQNSIIEFLFYSINKAAAELKMYMKKYDCEKKTSEDMTTSSSNKM